MTGHFQVSVVDELGRTLFFEQPMVLRQGDGITYGPVTVDVNFPGGAVVAVKGTVRVVWLAPERPPEEEGE